MGPICAPQFLRPLEALIGLRELTVAHGKSEPERSREIERYVEEQFAQRDRARARALLLAGFPTLPPRS